MSQARLGRLINTDHSVVSRIENGERKRVPFEIIGRIAEVLGLDLNDLYIKIERKIEPDEY